MEDPAVKGAVQRKNVQTLRAHPLDLLQFCVTDSVPRTCVDVAYGAQDPLALPAPKAEQLHGGEFFSDPQSPALKRGQFPVIFSPPPPPSAPADPASNPLSNPKYPTNPKSVIQAPIHELISMIYSKIRDPARSRKSLAGCVCWQVECCLERKSRDVDAVDKQHSSVSPRKCQSLYLDLPMKKGNSIVNGKGEGPPDKHSSLKPSTEMEDPAMKGAVQRKNVQTLRAEQDILVASEEERESLERSEKKQPQLSLKHAL
ncbi:PREDICTED: uncharacterized protein LOC105519905 [Colobus angolensis palliatus]|uniref:uncharacterized protein LOC105519905 n=1 Tax=Colobus angolensis palliatus TaxID=336983 RepID=UPI0005F522A1|nr:PREDICTED: uncharacterized protein LOC105519905 [Colobus angolensis palliatus]